MFDLTGKTAIVTIDAGYSQAVAAAMVRCDAKCSCIVRPTLPKPNA
ncbi:MAG: hypothetical protein ACLUSP_08785 [Christensenellales bacterium]